MANLGSMIVDDKPKQVDREKVKEFGGEIRISTTFYPILFILPQTCPLLLRVFCNTGRHHSIIEFAHGEVPSNELQIYTWQDATLRELTSLVREVNPDTRRKGTYFDFALIFMERNGGYHMREIGVTCSGQKGADDSKTLAQSQFVIGDYLDICITPPNRNPQRRPRY